MSNEIRIQATARKANGSGEARRVRRAGQLPAALNRLSRATETLQLNAHEFMMATRGQESHQMLVVLEVEGQPVNALLREIQRDVITGEPIHVDFGEVDMTKTMRAEITIRLVGEPEGVRTGGGVLTHMTREVLVECLPVDFVESFEVDVSGLKVGDSITVADLKLGDKYTLLTDEDEQVAAVTEPEDETAAAPAEAAPAEGGEGKAAEGGEKKAAEKKPAAAPAADKKAAAPAKK